MDTTYAAGTTGLVTPRTYAQRAGYGPPGSGAIALHLRANGKYHASHDPE